MSVREYIGARYVPIFAEPLTWDATRTYEPLTVVLYQGNSYTSRQAVPANIEITNTTYWAQTGNYNAQIEQYRSEVQTFDGRITANAQAISGEKTARQNAISGEETARQNAISGEETARQNADTALGGRIDGVGTRIDNLIAAMSNGFYNRNYILLGDSFGGGIYPTDSSASQYGYSEHGWLPFTKGLLEAHGCSVWTNNDAIVTGNSGFTSTAKFITMLNNLYNNVIDNPEKITDIVVMAGTNDRGSNEPTIIQAVSDFVNACKNLFPNAMVRIGALGTNISSGFKNVAFAYKQGATIKGAKYIRSTYNLFTDQRYISVDNIHLTQEGYAFYKRYVAEAAIFGETSYMFQENNALTVPSGYTLNNNGKIFTNVTPEGTYVYLKPNNGSEGNLVITVQSPNTSAHSIDLTVADTMPELPVYNFGLGTVDLKGNVQLKKADNSTFNTEFPHLNYGGVFMPSKNTLRLQVSAIDSTFTTSMAIFIPNNQVFIPAV